MKTLALFLVLAISPLVASCNQVTANTQATSATAKQRTSLQENYLISRTTDYYKSSPAQARSADGQLQAGTKVQLKQNAGSYALVKITSGANVYVSADDLQAE